MTSKPSNAMVTQQNVPKKDILLSEMRRGKVEKLQLNNENNGDHQSISSESSNVFNRVDIGFKNLSYSVKTGILKRETKVLLRDVHGDFLAGDLTAVVGPSGAGKSTLLNILAGFTNVGVQGSLTVNGLDRHPLEFRSQSCYIMQDDNLQPLLTVMEAMRVAANLKLGTEMSVTERDIRILSIINAIGLSETQHTKTENLSGGQRKRLSIALELLRNPQVMFFDEPTSGLDSSASKQCIALLKKLSQEGRTIICTIHQPSALVLDMFDHIYGLVNGECVYQGSVKGLIPYLNEVGLQCPSYHNPADFFLEVSTGEHGNYHNVLVQKSENGKNPDWRKPQSQREIHQTFGLNHVGKMMASGILTPVTTPQLPSFEKKADLQTSIFNCRKNRMVYPTSFFTQFLVLLKRTAIILSRARVLTYMRLGIHLFIAIVIGILYYRIGEDAEFILDNFNYLFFSIMFLMFTAFNSMILTFPLEVPIITIEHFNRWYSVISYYLAVTIADIPVQLTSTLLYTLVTYHLTSQPLEFSRLGMFVLMCILVSFIAQSIGLVIGSIMNVQNGTIFGPLFIFPFIMFSGYFVRLCDAHPALQWIFHISFLKHGLEGVMLAIFGFERSKLKCSADYCHFVSPQKFLDEVDMENADYTHAFLTLLTIFISLRVLTYIVLLYKFKSKR